MGNTNTLNITTNFNTDVSQVAKNNCLISCTSNFNDNTFIAIGVKGGIRISQSCMIQDASCQIKSAFDANIENIIDITAKQAAESTSLAIIDGLGNNNNNINIETIVSNKITQLMMSSCVVNATNNMNNNYFLIMNAEGGIYLTNTGSITSASCTIDNIAKATVSTETTLDTDQSAISKSALTVIFIALIVVCAVIVIILLAFIFGGKKKAKAAPATVISLPGLTPATHT